MTCTPCAERRRAAFDAWMAGKIAEAAGHLAKGAAEMVGLKCKHEFMEQNRNEYGENTFRCPECGLSGIGGFYGK